MAKGLWVVLNVDNIEKSVEFYRSIGLKVSVDKMDIPGMPTASMGNIDLGGSGIMLWNKHVVPPDQPADTRAWVSGELGKGVLFTVGVPNAAKLWTKAEAARVTVDQPLQDADWGGKEFSVVDPDGYVIAIADRVPSSAVKRPAKRAAKKVAKAVKRTVAKGRAKTTTKRR